VKVRVWAALRVGESLGGHWVSGHVEALAKLKARKNHGDFEEFTFEVSDPIRKKVAPYLIPKGSIAVDGVSLTINELRDEQHFTEWTHMLIPHTLERTHFVSLKVGELVNIECDLMAKYLERFRLFLKLN
jgi:riboflavin synthase